MTVRDERFPSGIVIKTWTSKSSVPDEKDHEDDFKSRTVSIFRRWKANCQQGAKKDSVLFF